MCTEIEPKMKNKHHIIPKYMGGSDDPNNLVEVTLTQHAMFHYCNWQLWGNLEDKIAWRAISGQISIEEVIYESRKLGGINCHKNNPDHIKNLKRTGNPHKLWRGTPPEMRDVIAKKIQKTKGTQVTFIDTLSGETKTFPSLKSAREYYKFGMTTIRKLYSGKLPMYKNISLLRV